MTGSALNFCDVVLIPFPFTDQSSVKKRPAVVISSVNYNSARPDVVLMAVTSRLRDERFAIVVSHWEAAGLLKLSVIKPLIATIEQGLVIRRLGCLSEGDRRTLRDGLVHIIGLEDTVVDHDHA